ncbi:MAG: glycosyltransferase family 9 protein [Candidatus Eisenbacteria bacterium]|uniref:Glycosyltransferase family 9 protein n=1 Tax=Eiseniibacteriota bacterium TaxID=2212470 RepID=A0A538S8F8_UNCEI|nr:MAG: glycosyltransferase family 9 protein [Candidatus Eisenbacteria bacterium]
MRRGTFVDDLHKPRAGRPDVKDAPRRVLVTRLKRIGDAILTLSVVEAIRESFPACAIDFLAEEEPAQAAIGHPAVDRVLALDRAYAAWMPASPSLLWKLRARRYDWVLDLYGNPRSALLSAWTGAPVRVGPARRGRRHLYTHPIPPAPKPLTAIEHHLRSLEALGLTPSRRPPRIALTEPERAEGRSRLDRALSPGSPRVGLHPGNRWPAKRWPESRFAALVRAIPRLGARPVVLAGPGEEEAARRIAAGSRPGEDAPVLGGLPLRASWGVIAALDALVTVDGSPLHAGPALRVPTVGILGPTEPEIWFPYGESDGHQLLCREIWCRPCHRHECARMDCLDWIGVGDALQAVGRALAHGGGARASA